MKDTQKSKDKVKESVTSNALFDDEDIKEKPKQKKTRKKSEVKTTRKGHKIKVIPTPTCTGNVVPTLMATGYANADYKNFYSVGHFPKLGILEVWKDDSKKKIKTGK